ncbi:MAG: hypothetical protein ACHQZQ_06445 [SAR324 cluster bacterium]
MVAIAAGLPLWEAQILCGRLEAEDIFATVIGEHDFENRLIRVLVRKEDAPRALEIKNEAVPPEQNSI